MDNFLGLVRDTLKINNPVGTWQNGKNMVLTEQVRSIANEDGFDFKYNIPGITIGKIVTNKDIVYFIKNNEGVDEVGRVNLQEVEPIYETVFKTNLLNFNLNCPIEGVFIYNFKNELIVAWCDGVFDNSNTPYLVNLDNLPLELNIDFTLVNEDEFTKVKMFPNVKQGDVETTILESGSIEGQAVYVTYAYVFNDDTSYSYFQPNNLIYIEQLQISSDFISQFNKKGLKVILNNLDSNFNKLKIGLVISNEGDLVGYESSILSYSNNSIEVSINSLNNYFETAVENILISTTIFDKINTITLNDKESLVGNTKTKEDIKFQKYANLLELIPFKHEKEHTLETGNFPRRVPPNSVGFASGEVYSFYIELQYLDGSYSKAAHIPGRTAETVIYETINQGLENEELTTLLKSDYALEWTDEEEINYKYFHIFNRGYVNPDINNETDNKFGYWENKETYPNTEDYNSTIDYDGFALGGQDMRNSPIRYHRMPNINNLFNIQDDISNNNKRNSLLGVKVTNFNTVFPSEILDKIQGYRISFVKRTTGNSIVLGHWSGTRRDDYEVTYGPTNNNYFFSFYDFNREELSRTGTLDVNFNNIRVVSPELFKFRPTLTPTFIQTNHLKDAGASLVFKEYEYAKVKQGLRYVPAGSINSGTLYTEEGINLDIELADSPITEYLPMVDGQPTNELNNDTYSNFYNDVLLDMIGYLMLENVYQGFESNDLVVLGKSTDIQSDEFYFKGGDIFNNVYSTRLNSIYTQGTAIYIYDQIIYSNYVQLPINQISFGLSNDVGTFQTDIEIVDSNGNLTNTEQLINYGKDFEIFYKEGLGNSINNLNTITTNTFLKNTTNKFPYRINRSLSFSNEALTIEALRTFLPDNYYEITNNKGEIIALRAHNRKLYIQTRYALFTASIKDSLKTNEGETFLGSSDLFDRQPQEIFPEEDGYIGSISKFACKIIKGSYVTINSFTGQIFIVNESADEITAKGNKNWFWNNFRNSLNFNYILDGIKNPVDNPYMSVGFLLEFDKEYNRIIIIKKFYEFLRGRMVGSEINEDTINFDGEFYSINGNVIDFNNTAYFKNKSITLSYSLEKGGLWAFEHDYFPNIIFNNINTLYSIVNNLAGTKTAKLYQHNSKINKGLFYDKKYNSYVDIIFNGQKDITKKYQMFKWITTVINEFEGEERFKTVTHVVVYNNNQCSGIINLKDNQFKNNRSVEGEWNFNEFRDLVFNRSRPVITDNGDIDETILNFDKSWFDKSNFISKFIVLRLIVDNIDNNKVYINQVNSKAIKSNR